MIWWDGEVESVEGFAAPLLAQAVNFGNPADLHQELEATTNEPDLLHARLIILELLAEADVSPVEA